MIKLRQFAHYLVVFSSIFLLACSAELDDYHQSTPEFDLFGYFNGHVKAWGMVQDFTDKQTRRFDVDIVGHVEGNQLRLVEDFQFHDGEKSQRVWVINRLKNGRYKGEADDIVGVAVGEEVGNALRWQYDFTLQLDDSEVTVSLDDWLYRQDENHVFNLTKIKKFGLEVGSITLFFQKQAED